MRNTVAVGCAMLGALSCAELDKHVIDNAPQADWCRELPFPIELNARDGRLFARARHLDKLGADEWIYFDKSGTPILIERTVPGRERYFASYYPNGQKRFGAAFKLRGDPPEYAALGAWEFFLEDGRTDTRPLPDDFTIYHPIESDQQDPLYFPPEMERAGVSGAVCSLVCVDTDGTFVGAFLVKGGEPEFEKAAAYSFAKFEYAPQRIGDFPLPGCTLRTLAFPLDAYSELRGTRRATPRFNRRGANRRGRGGSDF